MNENSLFFSNETHDHLGHAIYLNDKPSDFKTKTVSVSRQPKASLSLLTLKNFITVNNNFQDLSIAFVYVLPNSTGKIYEESLDFIFSNACQNLIILGDFNKNPNDLTKKIQGEFKKRNMSQLIKEPSHLLGNILDHIYCNLDQSLIASSGILSNLTKSDHYPIYLSLRN